jgi:hypothetical protein
MLVHHVQAPGHLLGWQESSLLVVLGPWLRSQYSIFAPNGFEAAARGQISGSRARHFN